MAPSAALQRQSTLKPSPRLGGLTPLKPGLPTFYGGIPYKAGWSGPNSPSRKLLQLERPQGISCQPIMNCNFALCPFPVLTSSYSADGISAFPSFANQTPQRVSRTRFCAAKATGPVKWSKRDSTKVFYRPVRMPASKEVLEESCDGSGGAPTAEVAPHVESISADFLPPSREHVGVDDSVSPIDNSLDTDKIDAESTSSPTTQSRRLRESSPWWKKNFSSGKRPRLEPSDPDSESTSGLVDTDLESCDSEASASDSDEEPGVKEPSEPAASTSTKSLGHSPDQEDELMMLRKRGKKGRVVVKYGKGKAVLRSRDWKAPSSNGWSGDPSENGAWFPHSGLFEIEGAQVDAAFLKRALQGQLAQNRVDRIAEVVAGRSYAVVPVVEGLNNLANVSAVCRTAEALGCQSVHAIAREKARYKASGRVSAGSDKWLDLELWTDTQQCLRTLKKRGYRIAVTCMDELGGGGETLPIHEIDWTIPTAVVLGNEMFGVTGDAKELADIGCYIPMGGFTDSFNIAHAAAILMYHAVRDRIQRQGFHADLTPEQRDILTAEFYLRTNRTAESVVHRLLELEGAVLRKAPKDYVRSLVEEGLETFSEE